MKKQNANEKPKGTPEQLKAQRERFEDVGPILIVEFPEGPDVEEGETKGKDKA